MHKPEHFSDPKVIALQTALGERDPFYSGMCSLPDYQRSLRYTHGDFTRHIDFSSTGTDDLEALYRACKPAEFGRNGENVLDESYRKAGKMDLTSFSTLFDPRSLRIYEDIFNVLLTQSFATMDIELYKLNVYGKGDFFKAHKDTPRSQDMFGSLVVVFPTRHEGGQFVLRQGEKEWTIDFADRFATATEPSVCFVAFYSDIEHEVLPVTSGYRLTLTYNLYHRPVYPSTSSISTPFQLNLKQALVNLVNDKSKLPNGGYLGFGLVHEYIYTGRKLLELLLYRGITGPSLNLITTEELDVSKYEYADIYGNPSDEDFLRRALVGLNIEQIEGVILVGQPGKLGRKPEILEDDSMEDDDSESELKTSLRMFYRNPITEVLEVTPMKSSVDVKSSFMTYGNDAEMSFFYGTACMLIAVEPAESRHPVKF
ncbi:hypothetical protein HD554DRAFT_2179589 [Boletus coccyginus]|nr:hypothetical protein HD554DRAFT_2179589 [Boletus coccyginus]